MHGRAQHRARALQGPGSVEAYPNRECRIVGGFLDRTNVLLQTRFGTAEELFRYLDENPEELEKLKRLSQAQIQRK
jgi:hypothetical protein